MRDQKDPSSRISSIADPDGGQADNRYQPQWARGVDDGDTRHAASDPRERTTVWPEIDRALAQLRGKAAIDAPSRESSVVIDGLHVPPSLAHATLTGQQERAGQSASPKLFGVSRRLGLLICAAIAAVAGVGLWNAGGGSTLVRAAGLGAFSGVGGDRGLARDTEPRAQGGCATQSSFQQDRGLVHIVITNPCGSGKALRAAADGLTLTSMFDAEGRASLVIPLFNEEADIHWRAGNEREQVEHVRVSGFADLVRVGLVWRDVVDLALHVVEPGADLGGRKGHVSPLFANEDLASASGMLRLTQGEAGGDRIEIYDLPPDRNPREGIFRVYVAMVGGDAAAHACASANAAGPSFQLHVLRYGVSHRQDLRFKQAPCAANATRPIKFLDLNAAPG